MKNRDPFAVRSKAATAHLAETAKFLRLPDKGGTMWCAHAYSSLSNAARSIGGMQALAQGDHDRGAAVRALDARFETTARKLAARCFIEPFERGRR